MSFKRILVACDFSDASKRSLALAAELSAKTGAALDVLHVHPDIYDGRGDAELGLPWPSQGQTERYLRFMEDELGRLLREVDPELSERATRRVVRGEPAKRVLAVAEETGADLICLGSTGKGAVERMMLGSVSQAVLRASKVPVLVTH